MIVSFRLEETRPLDRKIIYMLNHCENRSDWIRGALLADIERVENVESVMAAMTAAPADSVLFAHGSDWDLQTTANWIHMTGGRSDDDLKDDLAGYDESQQAKIIDLVKEMEANDVCEKH